jgi:hypothetical protein
MIRVYCYVTVAYVCIPRSFLVMFVIRERLYAHPVDYGSKYEDLPIILQFRGCPGARCSKRSVVC